MEENREMVAHAATSVPRPDAVAEKPPQTPKTKKKRKVKKGERTEEGG
jgi:hypothetical protein